MGSHTITISDDAYRELRKRKKENESFTDVILRLSSEKGNIRKLLDYINSDEFPPISEETAKKIEESSREMRRNFKLRNADL
jgi:predicted CopG family antitoxin